MKKNLVLIGLSGCGKTTIGKILAQKLSMSFVDMDEYIEQKEGKTVSQIFSDHGEAYFRQAETSAAKTLSETGGKMIATGGGVVLKRENMEYLKQNGVILFLDRTPEEILQKIDVEVRPLLAQDKNRLFVLDRERRPLYEAYADLTVRGCPDIAQTVKNAMEAISPLL